VNAVFAVLAGLFLTAAVYLLLSRSLIRLLLGLVILGNAINLLIFVAGRLTPANPPILEPGAVLPLRGVANPLPQALILTAIVIGFALVTFMIILVWRALAAFGVDDTSAMRLAEPQTPPIGPADY
jgi:multicomponent Na+:H+ antiporter subunit C